MSGFVKFSKGSRRLAARGAAALVCLGLAGCVTPIEQGVFKPVVSPVTIQNSSLRSLPPPEKRIIVAVYDYPDLTGQYKERENVQSLSRAVTQGGATMLIKALQDAGERRWFTVLDRAGLNDLLKERQIVTEMRKVYRNEQRIDPGALPPLRHAGVILQGGIIGYDTNTLTGGIGARYLGIGGDTKWKEDTVTVTLRAVSTNSGEVLTSVTTHKTIASFSVQGGAFRYIALDELLEAEAGLTQNEPKQIAVHQAIEKAVLALIVEGVELGIWSFEDKAAGDKVVQDYLGEKYRGGKIPEVAYNVPAPETADPARVVETKPRRISRPRVTTRTIKPAAVPVRASAPPVAPPPPPADDETVG